MLKDLPIGSSDFKDLITKQQYYVDKNEMIENLLKQRNKVSLFPRPRRFGKSLFISMLDNFFNIEYKDKNFNIERTYVKLPNREVRYLFSEILLKILTEGNRIDLKKVNEFCDGIFENDKEAVERGLNQMLPKLSYHDLNESGYHNYVMALFTLFINDNNYIVYSNRESGMGRFDIMIKDKQFNKGIIIEFKVTKDDMEKSAINALNQIEEKEYYLDLINEGYKEIIKYAIVFKSKKCIVR